ncbi:MAG TPA: hypothetical protein PK322_03985 [Opitutaceae bacterium]|nr:hypothetical protein [Opitutaceae bacterium]
MTAQELSRIVGNEMGLGSWLSPWGGTPAEYSALDAATQIELTNRMRAYIREHPADFAPAVVAVASSGAGYTEAPDANGLGSDLATFFGEVGAQAADLNQTLNPFSERNRGYVLAAVAVGLVLYFAGPQIVAAIRKGARAAK